MDNICNISGAKLPDKKIPFEWEDINEFDSRAKVIGGWLFQSLTEHRKAGTCENSVAMSTVFIADPNHTWEIA